MNMNFETMTPLRIGKESNMFELTMLDVGALHSYQLTLTARKDPAACLVAAMSISRGQYYQ